MMSEQDAEAMAEANRLAQSLTEAIATASPSRLASITRNLKSLTGDTNARDMTPDEYALAKAKLTRAPRRA